MPKTIILNQYQLNKPIIIPIDKILHVKDVNFTKGGSARLITLIDKSEIMVTDSLDAINEYLLNN